MRDLLLVVPSRGRPQNISRLIDQMITTCRGDTTLLVGTDADDPTWPGYLQAMDRPSSPVELLSETHENLRQVVAWINKLAVPRTSEYRFIGHIGDDNVPETDGWDVAMMAELESKPFAFGNDLYPRAPGSLSCHVFTRSDVIRRLGYFGPPEIRHMYVDVAWMAWGTRCGIAYRHDVLIPHKHFTTGAPMDESYALSQACIPPDLDRWHEYCTSGRLNRDIQLIDPQAAPFTGPELAQFNRDLNIPVTWGGPLP